MAYTDRKSHIIGKHQSLNVSERIERARKASDAKSLPGAQRGANVKSPEPTPLTHWSRHIDQCDQCNAAFDKGPDGYMAALCEVGRGLKQERDQA